MNLTNGTTLQFIEDPSPTCDHCQLDSWKCSLLEDNGKKPICEYKGYFIVIQPPNKIITR